MVLLDVESEGLECPFETPRMAKQWPATWRLNAKKQGGPWDCKVAKIGPQGVGSSYLARRLRSRSFLRARPDLF